MEDIVFDGLLEKTNFLKFRGLIIRLSVEQIVNAFETEELYKDFLDSAEFALYHDQYFFILKNFSNKTLSILKESSIKFSTKGIIRQTENGIISSLNSLNLVFDKEGIKEDYFRLEKGLRLNLPITEKDVYRSMGGDYNVIFQITKAMDNNSTIEDVECRQFLESTDFFLSSLPEFYSGFPDAIPKSLEYLKNLLKQDDYRLNRGISKIKRKLKTF